MRSKHNYSFDDDCNEGELTTSRDKFKNVGFPDQHRNIEECPCASADGEVILMCHDRLGIQPAYGMQAMRFKGVGIFQMFDAQGARDAANAMLKLADDLDKANGDA